MKASRIAAVTGITALLFTAAFFVVRFPPTAQLWAVSVAAIVLFSLPVIIGCIRWLGVKKGSLLLGGLGLYAFIFETIAVVTGVPYGFFSYSDVLGPRFLDLAPYTVLLAWTPLVLGIVAFRFGKSFRARIVTATLLLVAVDMVLDPAAVYLGFWAWEDPGRYYGVPFVNLLGWIISGGIAVSAVEWLKRRQRLPPMPAMLGDNLLAVVAFWAFVNLFAGQWVPCVIAGILIPVFLRLRSTPASAQ